MACCEWREKVETTLPSSGSFDDGWGFHYQHGKAHYLNAWLTAESLKAFMREMLLAADLVPIDCPTGLRLRSMGKVKSSSHAFGDKQTTGTTNQHSGELHFACNYGPDTIDILLWTDCRMYIKM